MLEELRILLSSETDNESEKLFRKYLPQFANGNFFSPLDEGLFSDFHKKLSVLSSFPHGVGLSVAIMAEINIAGFVLKKSKESGDEFSKRVLEEIIRGEKVASMGVSEKNWNGRMSGLKSAIEFKENFYILNAEKSFLTNGFNADYFLLVVKDISGGNYRVVCLDRETEGLQIEKFSLPFATEATHVKIKCENLKISKNQILPFDYKKNAENLRLSEILSLTVVFCGWVNSILFAIKERKGIDQVRSDEGIQKKILKIKTWVELLFARVIEVSAEKDKNPDLNLLDHFPFGYEEVSDIIIPELEFLCEWAGVQEIFLKDIGLFKWRDALHSSYIRKAMLRTLSELDGRRKFN